ncbi:MAG: radical SAM protein [Clostridia bacterium]|nr:radical SAM protein [Clostridia bacterium]
MNEYLKNLNKIEFVVTSACSGRCKHCSQGDHTGCAVNIDAVKAVDVVRTIIERYKIETVMTFGGEPLLHREAVYAIMHAASEASVPRRQLITNGYFTEDISVIRHVAKELSLCGVNDLLLSVDAFHQETIPIKTVRLFADEAIKNAIPLRLQPAWLVSEQDENLYNVKTRELLDSLSYLNLPISKGNIIFPEGNALKYLSEYFTNSRPTNPYEEDPTDIRCASVSSNGDLLGGNIYREDITEIIRRYKP